MYAINCAAELACVNFFWTVAEYLEAGQFIDY